MELESELKQKFLGLVNRERLEVKIFYFFGSRPKGLGSTFSCWGLGLLSSFRECWHTSMSYLSAGQSHRGNVGILQLVQGTHNFLKGFSVEFLIHNLHLKRTHTLDQQALTVPLQDCCSTAGNMGSHLILAAH